MTSYNVTIQLTAPYTDQLAAAVVDALADYHAAASRSPYGHPEVVLTLQAETLRQAVTTGLALINAAGYDAYSIDALPTEAYDQRLELEPVPELLSVTEAADQLGVSRQAVQQRIDAGTLPARRVGKAFAIPSGAIGKDIDFRGLLGENIDIKGLLGHVDIKGLIAKELDVKGLLGGNVDIKGVLGHVDIKGLIAKELDVKGLLGGNVDIKKISAKGAVPSEASSKARTARKKAAG